jgi:hypothetical protein
MRRILVVMAAIVLLFALPGYAQEGRAALQSVAKALGRTASNRSSSRARARASPRDRARCRARPRPLKKAHLLR